MSSDLQLDDAMCRRLLSDAAKEVPRLGVPGSLVNGDPLSRSQLFRDASAHARKSPRDDDLLQHLDPEDYLAVRSASSPRLFPEQGNPEVDGESPRYPLRGAASPEALQVNRADASVFGGRALSARDLLEQIQHPGVKRDIAAEMAARRPPVDIAGRLTLLHSRAPLRAAAHIRSGAVASNKDPRVVDFVNVAERSMAVGTGDLPTELPHSKSGVLESATSSSLVGSMAKRLQKVEAELTEARGENQQLRLELKTVSHSLARFENSVQMFDVVSENEALKRELADIKRFLGDYGLTWVGSPADSQSSSSEERDRGRSPSAAGAAPAGPPASARKSNVRTLRSHSGETKPAAGGASSPQSRIAPAGPGGKASPNIDIAVMQRKLTELSSIAEREAKIVQVQGQRIHRFEVEKLVKIVFFQDGMKVGCTDNPFFKYEHPTAQRVLRDILDGYFPFLLKEEYPDGVRLEAVDRLRDCYDGELDSRAAQEQFLKRLPKQIIMANGQIVDVRKDLEARLLSRERGAAQLRAANNAHLRLSDQKIQTDPTAAHHKASASSEEAADHDPAPRHSGTRIVTTSVPALPRSPSRGVQAGDDEGRQLDVEEEGVRGLGPAPDVCSILLKHREGSCRVSLPRSATVAELYGVAKEKLGLLESERPLLKSAFPPPTKLLADMAATLESVGLFPNGTVHLG
eukprot:g18036.t1